jgi:hypothetical protein
MSDELETTQSQLTESPAQTHRFVLLNISQETEETSTPTRPVENVVLTTKGLQDRNIIFYFVNVLFIFILMFDLMLILLKNNLNVNKNKGDIRNFNTNKTC